MFNTNDLLEMLQAGKTESDIAGEFCTALNKAIQEKKETDRKRQEKEEIYNRAYATAKSLVDSIADYCTEIGITGPDSSESLEDTYKTVAESLVALEKIATRDLLDGLLGNSESKCEKKCGKCTDRKVIPLRNDNEDEKVDKALRDFLRALDVD